MAAVGTVTVNVEVGDDLEAAIRKIVRNEVEKIAYEAYKVCGNGSPKGALYTLATAASPRD